MVAQVQAGEVQCCGDRGCTGVVGSVKSDQITFIRSLRPVLGLQPLQYLPQRDVLSGVLNVVVKVRVLQLN